MHCPLPLFSPVSASRVFYGFLPQSLRVIFQKFMAARLTHSICSPKLGSVEKSIRQVQFLPFGGRTGSSANKQKTPNPRTKLIPLPGTQSWNRMGKSGTALRSALPVWAQENLRPGRALSFSVGTRLLSF